MIYSFIVDLWSTFNHKKVQNFEIFGFYVKLSNQIRTSVF